MCLDIKFKMKGNLILSKHLVVKMFGNQEIIKVRE